MVSKKRNVNNEMIKRLMILVFCLGGIGFVAVDAKLFYMQVMKYKYYQEKAVNQQTREVVITPKRGTIYDRNMKELAVSASTEMVTLEPIKIKEGQHEKISAKLSELLEMDYDSVYKKTKEKVSYNVVKKGVEKTKTDAIRSFIKDEKISGIYMHEDSTRYYPYGSFASHIIGFTGTDGYGLAGVEAQYNEELRGVPGREVKAQNAKNTDMPYQYETYIQEQNGNNVVLTVDEVMQHFLEKHLETALSDNKANNGVGGIIMDVKTGGVLAMSTKPDFDLNRPFTIINQQLLSTLDGLEGDEYKAAKSNALNKMWRNKPMQDTYEPGSTFKLFTVSTAVEEALVNEKSTFYCPGYKIVGPHRIKCWKTIGHGQQMLLQALQNSCNPSMMEIASRIGTKKFKEYYDAAGFMEKTGIDLPGEAKGVFFAEGDFNEVQLATSAFGQGFQVTPIQMITMASAFANDGKLMTPYVVKEIINQEGDVVKATQPKMRRQIISAQTSEFMREAMESVVSVGTGKNAYVAGYRVGGKTATSEKLPRGNGKYISSFIGVAPMDDPQVAVLVMIDEPVDGARAGGGLAVAPVVGNIMADILPYINVEPQYTDAELAALDISVPEVIGKSVDDAKTVLKGQKIKYKIIGEGQNITDQIPAPSAVVPATAEILLYTNGEKPQKLITIPSVINMSMSSATNFIGKTSLYMKMTGVSSQTKAASAKAVSQSPRAGEKVPMGSVVTVRFADTVNVGD